MGNEGTKIQKETMDETEKFFKLTPSDIIGDMDGLAVHELDESPGYRLDNLIMKSYGITTDKSSMKCITCNKELADKLGAALNKWEQFRWTAFYRHKKDAQKMAVVVSHPHGCSKQISLGQWLEKVKGEEENVFKHTYTACTCPGSSGAPVYFAGFTFNCNVSYGFQFNERAHSGAFGKEINFSF
ncbi:hypothetical protein Bpfe_028285 [Biomphalaria pfeifferi]|uniref:Peptidase S1 domain-containing protein n=1 Tax=Biomphalaria pfeifferi TaxID=112525 RepID=A0AAD8ATS5_BIOPF|nr:hypothetical protein Bpfe_028285 [Biomphalaria pfeifferi]